MPKPPRLPRHLTGQPPRLGTWNAHNGSGKPATAASVVVLDALFYRKHLDYGLVVTEAKALVGHLRGVHRVRVVGENPLPVVPGRPVPEHGDTVIVLDDRLVSRGWVAAHKLEWIVRRYARWHRPRRDAVVRYRRGLPLRGLRGVHLPPGGPYDRVNGRAWRAQMDKALRWAARGGPRVIAGDVNATKQAVLEYVERFLDHHPHLRPALEGLKVVGNHVDLFIIVGFDGKAATTVLGQFGSDHRAVVTELRDQ